MMDNLCPYKDSEFLVGADHKTKLRGKQKRQEEDPEYTQFVQHNTGTKNYLCMIEALTEIHFHKLPMNWQFQKIS